MRIALVGLAGALGALSRYAIGVGIGVRSFPFATLLINVVGSAVLGWVLAGPGADRWSTTATTAVAVGFLGAFTTFSTFAYETITMLRTDQPARALLYVALSVGLGLVAAAAGYALGRAAS
ncbi:MAG: fluoride exporter [Actinomycetota bacterium]